MSDRNATIPLAAEFEPATLDQWQALVDKALKGGDFEKRLVARTADGLRVPPLYTRADTLPEAGIPGSPPYTRGLQATASRFGWQILTMIDGGDASTANAAILADLEGGANGILLQIDGPGQSGVHIASPAEMSAALSGVHLDMATLELAGGLAGADAARHLLAALEARPGARGKRQFALNLDPLGNLARFGTPGQPMVTAMAETMALAGRARHLEPDARTIVADASAYHEAGASEGQELAALAATLTAYLRAFEAAGVGPADALPQIGVHLAADADIFLTAAKLRAARTIMARIAEACGAGGAAARMHLTAVTSARMMAKLDPWTNMLRTTVATAAAAIGGANSIVVLPFTHALGAADAFARRIARNTQIVAQEESHLGRVADPVGGSWYVEQATAELARKSWSIFQQIEAAGGLQDALISGMIEDQIGAVAAERAKAIATGRFQLTGVSAFPLQGPDGVTVLPRPPAARVTAPQISRPLPRVRLAAEFEALRDKADAAKVRPEIFLASLGEIADHTARSTWARNFLASGGIGAHGSDGYPTSEAATAAFQDSGAAVAVIASSDDIYAREAEALAQALKRSGARHVILAGRPGSAETAYRAAGIDTFIFAGQDAIATLSAIQALLGV